VITNPATEEKPCIGCDYTFPELTASIPPRITAATGFDTLATMTPHTMRFSMKAYPDKFRRIAMFLRDECGAPESCSLEDSIQEVETLFKDIGLGAPLSRQGLKEQDIERAADGVIRYMGGSITNDPAAPTREDLIAILRKVF
jgi:alcohol dehydrogenase class IV